MNRAYAGIGSRSTPRSLLALAERFARRMKGLGWVLRSGHAPGADQAFERGAGKGAEVYLPWPSFEVGTPLRAAYVQERPTEAATALAALCHPAWQRLRRGPRALHARNAHQVLGRDLCSPVSFVVCWTPDGSLDGRGPKSGGTGQALRIAAERGIPVWNLALDEHREHVERLAAGEDVLATAR